MRRLLATGLVSVAAVLGPPSAAFGSETIGDPLGQDPVGSFGCLPRNCTYLNPSLGNRQTTVPYNGRIVRWRVRARTNVAENYSLKVIRSLGGGLYTSAGTSSAEPVGTTLNTYVFSANLPVQKGDYIGIDGILDELVFTASSAPSGTVTWGFSPSLADSDPGRAPAVDSPGNYELLLNADVARPPTSSVSLAACQKSSFVPGTVTSDPDPATSPYRLHYVLDAGAERTADALPTDGTVGLSLSEGHHRLDYWGEDLTGQLEQTRHSASFAIDRTPPRVSIESLQSRSLYARGEKATIRITARDTTSGLVTDPSTRQLRLDTSHTGFFTVTRTAVDECGNVGSSAFAYKVVKHLPDRLKAGAPCTIALRRYYLRHGYVCKRGRHGGPRLRRR